LGGGGGPGGEMTQASYAHMNNKTIKIKKNNCHNESLHTTNIS
jgi:hypothetical protein